MQAAFGSDIDPYQVLGIEAGPQATDAEIKKAYRALALRLHPDKNKDDPKAAANFTKLQTAYEALLDPEARKALDALYKARAAAAERNQARSEKRRRMVEELDAREHRVAAELSAEQRARAKLHEELERLRRQAAERAAAAAQSSAAAAAAAKQRSQPGEAAGVGGGVDGSNGTTAAATAALTPESRAQLARTLKLSWSRRDGEYTAAELRAALAEHGEVEDLVLRDGKKKKGSALAVMATVEGAAAAARAVCGRLDNPLLVVPLSKVPTVEDGAAALGVPPTSPGGAGAAQPAAGASAATSAPPLFPSAPTHAAWQRGGGAGAAAAPSGAPLFPAARGGAPLFAAGAGSAAGSATAANGGASSGTPGAADAAPATGGGAGGGGATMGGGGGGGGGLFPGGVGRQATAPGGAAATVGSGGGGLFPGGGGRQPPGSPPQPAFASFPGAATAFSSFPSGGGAPGGVGAAPPLNRRYEDATMARMRQAAERAKLVAALRAEEEANGGGGAGS